MTTKVVKGTMWTMIGLTVPIFFSLFATPIVARLLGAEGYGLFVLVLLIPTYFSFADFGMNIASTKFGSAAFAEGSAQKEAKVVRTAALIALITSIPIAAAIAIFSPLIAEAVNVPPHRIGEAAFALKMAAVVFVINFLNAIFNTPELSRLRMDLNILVFSGVRLAGIITTPIVVYYGGGVIGAVAVALAVSILTLVGHLAISARLLPELLGFSIDRTLIRPLTKFGGSLVIAGIAGVLLANLEKVVLTKATSVEALAYYSVATTFAAMLTLFSGSIVQSLMPAFSQLQAEENRPALNALYSRGIRLTVVWLVPATVFMILAARPFFTYWFGPDYGRESTIPAIIVIGGFFFNVLAYFPYTIVMASGRSDLFAKIYWIELLPYFLTVWWLASGFGAAGAAAAWALRVIVDASVLFWLARKVGRVSFERRDPTPFLVVSALMMAPLGLAIYLGPLNWAVILATILLGAVYAMVVWNKVLDRSETAWLKATASRLLRKVNQG